ncbi:hypothetical protein [Chryseobacterium vrystaatense]|uniref:YD repeat-containing protein n=1 Tax=Chryseobacterium vrystaatense TaxID=307480 RepID=A0A1M4WJD0_9FLAO|nr:hypothetical protein [Chryseobacterium vrystaatense]SHE81260.1 hypothetical protein SAMN02787073_1178 [Chryseobacterium vrystaatense]
MKNIFKYFLIFLSIALLESCSDESYNTVDGKAVKYIKTYKISTPNGIKNLENWNYNNRKQVVEITRAYSRTIYKYDIQGRLIKADSYRISEPKKSIESYILEYEGNVIRITSYKRDGLDNIQSAVYEYIFDSSGKPIKRRDYGINGGTELIYTYQNGNIVRAENSIASIEYTYDDKRNVLYHYPIGFRLIMVDGLSVLSNNNIVNQKSSWGFEVPVSLTYSNDGYLVQISNQEFTQTFTY